VALVFACGDSVLIIMLVAHANRWHDLNHTAGYPILMLIPAIGLLVSIVLGCIQDGCRSEINMARKLSVAEFWISADVVLHHRQVHD